MFTKPVLVLAIAVTAWLQLSPPARSQTFGEFSTCSKSAMARANFEADLRKLNDNLKISVEVHGMNARSLTDIYNAFPPPSDISSDLSVLYTASRRLPLWVLYSDGCVIAVMPLPTEMAEQIFGASITGRNI